MTSSAMRDVLDLCRITALVFLILVPKSLMGWLFTVPSIVWMHLVETVRTGNGRMSEATDGGTDNSRT